MLARMWRDGDPLALLVGMQTGAATLENSMEVPQKVKNRTILRPSNCTTRYLPKGYKNTDSKGYMCPNVYSSIINNSQTVERAQMSISWWVDKQDVGHIYIYEYYSAIKKNEILPFAMMWMELECIMLSEKSQRKTNTIWFHSPVEFKKQNRWTYRRGEREKSRKQTMRVS